MCPLEPLLLTPRAVTQHISDELGTRTGWKSGYGKEGDIFDINTKPLTSRAIRTDWAFLEGDQVAAAMDSMG